MTEAQLADVEHWADVLFHLEYKRGEPGADTGDGDVLPLGVETPPLAPVTVIHG